MSRGAKFATVGFAVAALAAVLIWLLVKNPPPPPPGGGDEPPIIVGDGSVQLKIDQGNNPDRDTFQPHANQNGKPDGYYLADAHMPTYLHVSVTQGAGCNFKQDPTKPLTLVGGDGSGSTDTYIIQLDSSGHLAITYNPLTSTLAPSASGSYGNDQLDANPISSASQWYLIQVKGTDLSGTPQYCPDSSNTFPYTKKPKVKVRAHYN